MKALYIEDDFYFNGKSKRKIILRVIVGYSDYGILIYLKDVLRFLRLKTASALYLNLKDQVVHVDFDIINNAFGSFFTTHKFQKRPVRFITEYAALKITESFYGEERKMLYNYFILLFERLNKAYSEVYEKNGYAALRGVKL